MPIPQPIVVATPNKLVKVVAISLDDKEIRELNKNKNIKKTCILCANKLTKSNIRRLNLYTILKGAELIQIISIIKENNTAEVKIDESAFLYNLSKESIKFTISKISKTPNNRDEIDEIQNSLSTLPKKIPIIYPNSINLIANKPSSNTLYFDRDCIEIIMPKISEVIDNISNIAKSKDVNL